MANRYRAKRVFSHRGKKVSPGGIIPDSIISEVRNVEQLEALGVIEKIASTSKKDSSVSVGTGKKSTAKKSTKKSTAKKTTTKKSSEDETEDKTEEPSEE